MPHTLSPITPSSRSRRAPTTTEKKEKRSLLSEHGGTILLLAVFFLFGGYMLDVAGIKTAIDRLLSGMNQSAHAHDQVVASTFITVFPFVILAMGVVLVMILFGGRSGGKRRKKAAELAGGELSLHAFAELARELEISPKVSRAAYRIFQPEFGDRMRNVLEASLRTDLELDDDAVETLTGELQRRTDRSVRALTGCETVLDLLRAVDAQPDQLVISELSQRSKVLDADAVKGRAITPLPRRNDGAVRQPVPQVASAIEVPARTSSATFVRPARVTPAGLAGSSAATGV